MIPDVWLDLIERAKTISNHERRAGWAAFAVDAERRRAFGLQKYGTVLATDNGRSHLADAYQESMDLVVYLRSVVDEIEEPSRSMVWGEINHQVEVVMPLLRRLAGGRDLLAVQPLPRQPTPRLRVLRDATRGTVVLCNDPIPFDQLEAVSTLVAEKIGAPEDDIVLDARLAAAFGVRFAFARVAP